MSGGRERKARYLAKAKELLTQYSTVLVVVADNVSAKQLANVRRELRGKAIVLMGKNTLMRKAVRDVLAANPEKQMLEGLLPKINGNCGLVFTDKDIRTIRTALEAEKKPATARPGAIAPVEVNVPAHQTSLGPQETAFMQALGIDTKITKMKIEILQPVELLKPGDKVTASQAELLRKLNITPFEYGLKTASIFENGDAYPAFLLDFSSEDITAKMMDVIGDMTALSLGINYPSILWFNNIVYGAQKQIMDWMCISLATGYPTKMSVPHSFMGTFSDLMNLCVGAELYPKFRGTEDTIASKYKEYQDNPELAAAAAAAAAAKAEADKPKEEEKKEEEAKEEEESDDMDLGELF